MAGITKATPTSVFNGQSYLVIFDEVEDYSTATIDSILENGIDLGQIFEGSTTMNSDEASFEDQKDEQGDVIVSDPTAGTDGFDFEMADFSAAKLQLFMNGRKLTHSPSQSSTNGITIKGDVVGWGDKIPVIERPIGIINDKADKILVYPKARILTSRNTENKLFVLKSTAKAQDCNTEHLNTVMYADKISVNFAAGA